MFQIQKFEEPKFYVIDQISIYFPQFSSFFHNFLSRLTPWGEPIRKMPELFNFQNLLGNSKI